MASRVSGVGTALVVLALLALTSCIPYAPRPANDPRMLRVVRDHYNAHAAEPLPGCTQPVMVLVHEVANVGSTPSQGVLRLRVRFDFEQRDPATKELVCGAPGERFFTLQTVDRGNPVVLGMSGPTRPRS